MPDAPPMHDSILTEFEDATGLNPSWLPHLVRVLRRDHRAAWDAAVSTMISENTAMLAARREADAQWLRDEIALNHAAETQWSAIEGADD